MKLAVPRHGDVGEGIEAEVSVTQQARGSRVGVVIEKEVPRAEGQREGEFRLRVRFIGWNDHRRRERQRGKMRLNGRNLVLQNAGWE